MRSVDVFCILCVLCTSCMWQSGAGRDVKPMVQKVQVLKNPPKLSTSQWKQLVKQLQPKLDSKPTGTMQVPDHAGKWHLVNSHIIGGSLATLGHFPWQVALIADNSWFCGGSLIYSNWVMTAAHCIGRARTFTLTLGIVDRRNTTDAGVQVVSVLRSSVAVHNAYNSRTLANDIALLRLSRSIVTPTSTINLIRLPSSGDATKTFEGTLARVSGWGLTADGGQVSYLLNWANVTVISSAECSRYYGSYILASTLCTATNGGVIGTCNGDSGGPLIYMESDGLYTQIGVVSFVASSGCQSGPPDGFTRVTSYLGWISNVTRIGIRKK